jgi:hypothetical protein
MPQPDEYMQLPTWRVRQLQDIEAAAIEVRELIVATPKSERQQRANLVDEILALISDVLDARA